MAWSKEETISRSDMGRIQLGRLQKTVAYIYGKNPAYRKRLDAAGVKPEGIQSLDDVRRLPFTTKQDIRDHYPFNLFTASQEDIIEFHATSGTTGKPVVVGYTRGDIEVWTEVMARACTGAGITKKDIVQNIYGYGLFTGGLGTHYGAQRVGAAVLPMSGGNTQRQIMLMQDFGSTVLTSTPSFLMHIHEAGREMGVDFRKLKLRIGLLGAEPWSESMRRSIDESFGIKACDMYGLSEIIGPGVSFECHEVRKGLHINEDYFYPEVIHPETGEVLPYGEEGELVLTTVGNEGQPLLRYRTRDITRLSAGTCACGRTLVRMERICGRTDDMLIIRGVNFFPSQIESIILQRKGVSPHYMVVVDRPGSMDEVEVRVEVTDEFMAKAGADVISGSQAEILKDVAMAKQKVQNLKRDIKDMIGITVKVSLVSPGTIPRSEGKAKRVDDRRPKA
ncbi:MAG TPA: phenylacetate--CoA ligase, partial [Candidatus Methylomirabilis sp.]|nr:phenylacetate--CoA ligase [Candidatus Methylomirabilis sp.]